MAKKRRKIGTPKPEPKPDHDILQDPRHERHEMRLLGRAIRQGFAVPPDVARYAIEKMSKIVKGKHELKAIRATETLLRAAELTQKDDHEQMKIKRIDLGKATELIGLPPVVIEKAIQPPTQKEPDDSEA